MLLLFLTRTILVIAQEEDEVVQEEGTTTINTTTAAVDTNCTRELVSQCEEEFRRCWQGDCGWCLEGFVEWPDDISIVENTTTDNNVDGTPNFSWNVSDTKGCVNITKLTLEFFEKVFTPFWLEASPTTTGATTPEEAASKESIRQKRLFILREVALYVAQHNAQVPPPSYQLAINEFSASTEAETRSLGGYKPPPDGKSILSYIVAQVLSTAEVEETLPTQVDWVERGAVTSVKNQGHCGGCWSISTAGVIEGAAAISTNFDYLQSLSFQQLISCDKDNDGCDGGFPASALAYANNNPMGGLATLNNYEFTDGKTGDTTTECSMTPNQVAVTSELGVAVTYYGQVDDDTYSARMDKMKRGVARQPVAVAIKSNCKEIHNYRSGVLTQDGDCSCQPSDVGGCLDHAVLLVGFNDDHDPPYWKFKNSWGTGWGEDGYARIAQFNPHPTENSWGLFGILAEGIIALQASNTTAQVEEKPQKLFATWEIILISVGIFVAAAVLGIGMALCWKRMCSKSSSGNNNSGSGGNDGEQQQAAAAGNSTNGGAGNRTEPR